MSKFFIDYEKDRRGKIVAYTVCDCVHGMMSQHARFPVAQMGRLAAFKAAGTECDKLNSATPLMTATNHAFDRVFGTTADR